MEKHLHGILLLTIAGALYINVHTERATKDTRNDIIKYEEFNTGLEEKNRNSIADQLSPLLADLYVLYTKTLKYHWNVQGPFFNDLHAFFGKLYEQQLQMVDRVAERIRALGQKSPGTLKEFSQLSTLQETPGNNPKSQGMIRDLLQDYNSITRSMRTIENATAKQHDAGTNNMIAELIEGTEKTAWMLRSLLTE